MVQGPFLLVKILSEADAFDDEGIKLGEVLLCFNGMTIFIRVSYNELLFDSTFWKF
jgi:hypothetical protein